MQSNTTSFNRPWHASDVITVGILSYNRPASLKRAIHSAVSQTYQYLEIIISDNGSTDLRVKEIIKEFAQNDARIKCIFHPVNQGSFFSFHSALKEAQGKYFIWLADDDYWCQDYLETILERAQKSGAALTYGRTESAEIGEDRRVGKEMGTTSGKLAAVYNFVRFDSDSVIYGIFPTATGKKLLGVLRNWRLPGNLAANHPFLEYNFVSYAFIYGILASGGFCNASGISTTHFRGGQEPFSNSASLGFKHVTLFFSYILIHMQLATRFACAALSVGNVQSALFAPIAGSYLFLRRIGMICSQRFKNLIRS